MPANAVLKNLQAMMPNPLHLNHRQFMRRFMAAVLPRNWLLVNGPKESRSVCLTFDDGPDGDYTPQVLDVLRDFQVPATFFVVGRQVERYPNLVRRIVDEGHAIGHHTFYHGEPKSTSPRQVLDEVRRTQILLQQIAGKTTRFFRPPYGKVTGLKLLALWKAGQTVVLWNVDPKDYACQSPQELIAWFQDHSISSGDVILLHDRLPIAGSVIPHLVGCAKEKGLSFASLDQLLN
jgi:peptidoglycan/xylan/chitin deacetylase (PgdA/CDA1 family)